MSDIEPQLGEASMHCHTLALIHRCGGGLGWVVKAKCPVVVEEWDFSKITFGQNEGHLVDATISHSTGSLCTL
jgi:hypothetical protein